MYIYIRYVFFESGNCSTFRNPPRHRIQNDDFSLYRSWLARRSPGSESLMDRSPLLITRSPEKHSPILQVVDIQQHTKRVKYGIIPYNTILAIYLCAVIITVSASDLRYISSHHGNPIKTGIQPPMQFMDDSNLPSTGSLYHQISEYSWLMLVVYPIWLNYIHSRS